MGKSQVQNQNFTSMDVDNSQSANCRSTSGIWSWNGMSYTKSSAMLDACHNHLQQEHQRMVIGSPPPKPTPLIADVGDSSHYGDSIFSLHVPTPDGENNNCGLGASSPNEFAIGGGSSSEKIPGIALENYVNRRNGDSVDDVVLPARVQGLQLHDGACQQPIIVYEEIDASDESDASATTPNDEGGVLSLAVPPVDVHEEKKRPPLPDMDVSC